MRTCPQQSVWKHLIVLFSAVACSATLHAQTIAPLTLAQVASQARAIAHVKVADVQVRLEGNIYTFVDLQTLEGVKGSVQPRFIFRMLGGRLGDTVLDGDPPLPTFTRGDELVLFFGDSSRDGYPSLYFDHVYRVTSWASGAKTVSRVNTDAPASASQAAMTPLPTFLNTVRRSQ